MLPVQLSHALTRRSYAVPGLVLAILLVDLSADCHRRSFIFFWNGPGLGRRQKTLTSTAATVLVHEAAHADIHYDAESQKRKQDGRPTIAHERERDSGDGHQPHHHADIDRYLKDKHGHHPHD